MIYERFCFFTPSSPTTPHHPSITFFIFSQCRFHQRLYFFQPLFALGFEAEDQDRAGVGCTQQSPAVGENNAHFVHVHDFVVLSEFFLDDFHQPESAVYGVVIAEIAMNKKHAAAHFAGQHRFFFLQVPLGFYGGLNLSDLPVREAFHRNPEIQMLHYSTMTCLWRS